MFRFVKIGKALCVTMDWWWLLVFILLIFAGFFMFFIHFMWIKKYAPDVKVHATARRKRLPLVRITDSNDTEYLFVGERGSHGDPVFKDVGFGVQLTPQMQQKAHASRTQDGVPVFNYSVNFPFSISPKNAVAIKTILEYVRENPKYKPLSFLPDMELMTLIGMKREQLEKDAQSYIDMYEPEDVDDSLLITLIKDIQDETSALPLKHGEFSYRLAFENIASSFTAQDLHQTMQAIERMIRRKLGQEERILKLLLYGGVAFAGIIIAGAVAFSIVKG